MRSALVRTAALALVAIGTTALSGCDSGGRGDPAESADTTLAPTPTASTSRPETTVSPGTTVPSVTTVASPPVGAPSVVYTMTGNPTDPDAMQTLIDPVSGAVVGTEPVDAEASRRAQDALPGGSRSTVDLGDVAYAFDQVFYDSGTLNTDFYTDVDLCGQNVVSVRSAAGSALPARAHVLSVSPDDRYVVTLSSVCPEDGTMGADGVGTSLPFEATFQVFDARRPDLPGRTLLEGVQALNVGRTTYSANGRFVALETYDDNQQYHVFDVESGEELDLTDGCPAVGTNYSRFIGPWIGESSIALMLDCADGDRLLVRDLMPGGDELTVPVPNADSTVAARAEVDYAHFDTPATAWFVLCDFSARVCREGQGSDPLVELNDVSEASFLPLGYYPGG